MKLKEKINPKKEKILTKRNEFSDLKTDKEKIEFIANFLGLK